MAERQEHPPRPRRGDPGAEIVGHERIVRGDAECSDIARELLRFRIHMRPRIVRIGDGVDVEEHRARKMGGEEILRRQRPDAGHLVRRVDDLDPGIIEMRGEPVGRD